MKKTMYFIIISLFCFSFLSACSQKTNVEPSKNNVTTKEKKDVLILGIASSTKSIDELEAPAKVLQEKIALHTGFEVQLKIEEDYPQLVKDMEEGNVDIAFLNASSYVQIKNNRDIEPLVKGVRFGKSYYRAQYNVRSDSNINSIEDLVNAKGLKWAYPDKTSTAGYLFPALQLSEMGVTDLNQFVTVETGGHDTALKSLLNGDVDFVTTFEDARTLLKKDYPDINDKIKVIGFSEQIPNDNISILSSLDTKTKDKLKTIFLSFNNDEEVLESLQSLYDWSGVDIASDSDYKIVKEMEEKFQK